MQDLMQEVQVVGMDAHTAATGAVTSTTAGDYVNMENYKKVTFLVTTGTVTTGGKIGIRKATAAGGSGATGITSAWDGSVDYTGTVGTYTTAATTSSGQYMNVADADDSKVLYATFDAAKLSASYPYVGAYFVSSTWNAVITGVYLLHGGRYQQSAPPEATT